MSKDLITPFVEATKETLSMMAQTEVEVSEIVPDVHGNLTWGEVSGIIGLGGENTSGNLILSFDRASALSIISKMLMEEFTEITSDVVDAVGELTNIITGAAKRKLSEDGIAVGMASPLMISGKDVELTQFGKESLTRVIFSAGEGQFVLEISLEVN